MLGNGYMKGMEELQHAFGNYLTGADTTVHGTVAEDDKADLKECMDLYAGTYRARMAESLGVDFPCLWAMIRDEQFYQLCLDYIRHHPSTFSSIHLFGRHMVDFLREQEPYAGYSQVAEMAAFEWNIPLLWAALDREDDALPELEQQPCLVGWLLWRQNLNPG